MPETLLSFLAPYLLAIERIYVEIVIHIFKAGPAVLIRIRINTVFVLNTSYCVFEPYLPYLTVEKYDFFLKYVFPKIRIITAYFTFIYRIFAANRIVLWVWPLHG